MLAALQRFQKWWLRWGMFHGVAATAILALTIRGYISPWTGGIASAFGFIVCLFEFFVYIMLGVDHVVEFYSCFEKRMRLKIQENLNHFSLTGKKRIELTELVIDLVRDAHNDAVMITGTDHLPINLSLGLLYKVPSHTALLYNSRIGEDWLSYALVPKIVRDHASDSPIAAFAGVLTDSLYRTTAKLVVDRWCEENGKELVNLTIRDLIKIEELPEWKEATGYNNSIGGVL